MRSKLERLIGPKGELACTLAKTNRIFLVGLIFCSFYMKFVVPKMECLYRDVPCNLGNAYIVKASIVVFNAQLY